MSISNLRLLKHRLALSGGSSGPDALLKLYLNQFSTFKDAKPEEYRRIIAPKYELFLKFFREFNPFIKNLMPPGILSERLIHFLLSPKFYQNILFVPGQKDLLSFINFCSDQQTLDPLLFSSDFESDDFGAPVSPLYFLDPVTKALIIIDVPIERGLETRLLMSGAVGKEGDPDYRTFGFSLSTFGPTDEEPNFQALIECEVLETGLYGPFMYNRGLALTKIDGEWVSPTFNP